MRKALITLVKEAALCGRIPHPFRKEDVEEWRKETDPRKSDGSPYKVRTSTILSGASLKNAGTKNKNSKFLDIFTTKEGTKLFSINPSA